MLDMKTFFAFAVLSLATLPVSASAQSAGDEIIVTATKRAENIIDVPISITAFGVESLENLRPSGLADLSANVPNMWMPPAGEAGQSAIAIRGITSGINKTAGRAVGVYIDGIYVSADTALDMELPNISSVEVLKGPQGTLFGRDTISGAVNISTTKPSEDFGGRLSLGIGSYGHRNIAASLDTPALDDKVRLRFLAAQRQNDGHIVNAFNGQKAGAINHTSLGAQVYFEPSDSFDARLVYGYHNKDDRPNSAGEATTNIGSDLTPYTTDLNQEEIQTQTTHRLSLRINKVFENGYSLHAISGLSRTEDFYIQDGDRLPQAITVQQFDGIWDEFSQELQLLSPQEKRFNFLLGLYYQNTDRYYAPTFPLMSTAFLNQVFFLPPDQHPQDQLDGQAMDVKNQTFALFGHANFALTEQLSLFGGLRFTDDKKALDYHSFGEVFALFGLMELRHSSETRDQPISWTFGARQKLGVGTNAYASISRGFRSASIKDDFVSQADIDAGSGFFTKPEFVTNYEIGIKSRVFANRFRINAAAFYMDYTDIQVSIADPTFAFLRNLANAASAHIQGFEADITMRPAHGLKISAGLGYLKTRYDSFTPNPGDDRSGTGFGTAPKWTLNASVDYRIPIGEHGHLMTHLDYRDRVVPDDFVFETLAFVGDHATANAWLGYAPKHENWQVKLWVKNLTNADDPQTNFHWGAGLGPLLDNITVQYERPRSYGFALNYKFGNQL